MFKSRTVFVIGAGASCEAGLPAGTQLKQRIAEVLDIRFNHREQISGDYGITRALREAVESDDGRSGNINPHLHKAWQIRDVVPASAISIDNYLDAHDGDAETELCGKLGIVRSILSAESASLFRAADPERGQYNFDSKRLVDTWFSGFFQMATEGVRRGQAETAFNNVTLITFNYDRCIERFLPQALAAYYNLQIGEAQKIVGALPIIHTYGQVGMLPWQNPQDGIPFGEADPHLLPIARSIKTFTQGMDDEGALARMHRALEEAETVVFLGFAFHPSNVKLLSLATRSSAKRVFATTHGLSAADVGVVEGDIWTMLGKADLAPKARASTFEMANLKCGEFFQQYFRSLSAR